MSIRPTFALLAAFLLGFLLSTLVKAAETSPSWPKFHGPRGDNISTETGLLQSWPEEGPELLFKTEGLGHGYASVAIADGRIITTGNLGEQTVVTALDMDGEVLWRYENGAGWTASYPGTRGTPTIDGQYVYHHSPVGQLACIEAVSGKQVWTLNTLKTFGAQNIGWAMAESVTIDGDNAIVCPGGRNVSVVALDKRTGEVVWQGEPTGDKTGYATATVIEQDGLRIVLAMTAKALIGVDADNGRLLFSRRHETKYDVNATQPLYHNGRIFITSGYGTTGSAMLALEVDGKSASIEEVWTSRELDNQHGGVVLWDGHIYAASHGFNGGRWICLDWETGEVKYAERGVGKGSLTFADGMLYTLSERNLLGLVPATPDEHEPVGKFRVPKGGTGSSWAHPVVCGGHLYIRHSDTLFVYDVQAK